MATAGQLITNGNFSSSWTSYSKTIYKTSQYYYIFAESWGFRASAEAAFLADWHGYLRVSYWNGSGWSEVYSHYMQDTSSNKVGTVKINASGLSLSGNFNYHTTSNHNLWRVVLAHEKWGAKNGNPHTIYIGNCGTCGSSHYNSYLKGKPIYSNGTIGKSKCGVLDNGSSAASDSTVLSYFASQKGTLISASYEQYIIGARR